jgi:hypothetical protein
MKTLESITRFVVDEQIIQQTDASLRAAGDKGCECFVLWSGVREENIFQIRTLHVPKQTAYRFEDGLCVRVDGTELHRLNLWLFDNAEELAVQIHAHPTDAYHSTTDDTYPIVTMRGGISLVVPDFAKTGLRGRGVACYRLTDSGWDELSAQQVHKLFLFKE